jgi:endonuclease/exonuclease/phosphatase family metal-dependent hydrolase
MEQKGSYVSNLGNMRIVAWNVDHRSLPRRRPLKEEAVDALASLMPDVVVLTEYVEREEHHTGGPEEYTHQFLCDELARRGLRHHALSPAAPFSPVKQAPLPNRVLIASRGPLELVPLDGVSGLAPPWAVINHLHVSLVQVGVEIIGLRVPYYESPREWDDYWKWFAERFEPLADRRAVIIGDFNGDPGRARSKGDKLFKSFLGDTKWQVPVPAGEWSYWGRADQKASALDHALVAPSLRLRSAYYAIEEGGPRLFGPSKNWLSDHAPLVLDITP